MDKPDFVTNEHLGYLDDLRDTGATNMFGARSWLMDEFPTLSKDEAKQVLGYWMKTFGERHPESPRQNMAKEPPCPES